MKLWVFGTGLLISCVGKEPNAELDVGNVDRDDTDTDTDAEPSEPGEPSEPSEPTEPSEIQTERVQNRPQ